MSVSITDLPGFEKVGVIRGRDADAQLIGKFPREAAVYALAVKGDVRYIGAAERLARRMVGYRNRQIKNTSQRRVHQEMRKALAGGDVEIFALVIASRPAPYSGGLWIDPLIGVETGLIMKFKPEWNLRGTALTAETPILD
jgi:hypothetical protein